MKMLIIKMKNTGHVMAKIREGQYDEDHKLAKLLIDHYKTKDRAWGCDVEYVVTEEDEEAL